MSGVPPPPTPDKIAEAVLPTPVSSPIHDGLYGFLKSEVDPELSTIPLAAYCFMTGWMCVPLFYPPPYLSPDRSLSYHDIPQRRGVLLRHIRLVRVPNWQLGAGEGASSFLRLSPTRPASV